MELRDLIGQVQALTDKAGADYFMNRPEASKEHLADLYFLLVCELTIEAKVKSTERKSE